MQRCFPIIIGLLSFLHNSCSNDFGFCRIGCEKVCHSRSRILAFRRLQHLACQLIRTIQHFAHRIFYASNCFHSRVIIVNRIVFKRHGITYSKMNADSFACEHSLQVPINVSLEAWIGPDDGMKQTRVVLSNFVRLWRHVNKRLPSVTPVIHIDVPTRNIIISPMKYIRQSNAKWKYWNIIILAVVLHIFSHLQTWLRGINLKWDVFIQCVGN
mmetsp:Transcript_24913/g.37648  ORF Transcript_24913/g.37648 Transcript_24913/m.37648 type:complete len:213 (+) Transcript_24913:852-1490(+)